MMDEIKNKLIKYQIHNRYMALIEQSRPIYTREIQMRQDKIATDLFPGMLQELIKY